MATPIINPPNLFKDNFGDRIQSMKPNQPVIIDLVTLERLYLQCIPRELEIDPSARWVVIESVGRNNPFYQFTGSEDTIKFNLSWYCDSAERTDVLKKVKWLESLTKNDSYDGAPHPIKFIFGDMFKASTFIVKRAAYKLTNFNREFNMMPGLAFQEIELCRVTDTNLKREDILKLNT